MAVERVFSKVFVLRLLVSAFVGMFTVAPLSFYVADYVVNKSVALQRDSIQLLDSRIGALDGRLSRAVEVLDSSIGSVENQSQQNAQLLASLKTSIELQEKYLPAIAHDSSVALQNQAKMLSRTFEKNAKDIDDEANKIRTEFRELLKNIEEIEKNWKEHKARKMTDSNLDALLESLISDEKTHQIYKVRFRKEDSLIEVISANGYVIQTYYAPTEHIWFKVGEVVGQRDHENIFSPNYVHEKYKAMYPEEYKKQLRYIDEKFKSEK